MSAAYPLPAGTVEPKKSSFGVAALVFALFTVVSPVAVALATGYELNHNEAANRHNAWGGLAILVVGALAAVAVAGISSLIGTLTGVIALARGESQSWRPIVGLVVNAPVLLAVVVLLLSAYGNHS